MEKGSGSNLKVGYGWVWWVCVGDGSLGQWIVDVMSLQKMYGLYGLQHHTYSGDVTDAGRTNKQQEKIGLLSF